MLKSRKNIFSPCIHDTQVIMLNDFDLIWFWGYMHLLCSTLSLLNSLNMSKTIAYIVTRTPGLAQKPQIITLDLSFLLDFEYDACLPSTKE